MAEPSNDPANDTRRLLTSEAPAAGSMIAPPGVASLVRIPVPGTVLPNLPKGLVLTVQPPSGHRQSTPSIFIRNPEDVRRGKPGLRLDRGSNPATGRIDYPWNVEGGSRARVRVPNITNHMPADRWRAPLQLGARAFRIAGRILVVEGAVVDGVSIAVADRPWRRSLQVVSARAVVGVGATFGGFIGFLSAEATAGFLYDFAAGPVFAPMPEVPAPA